MAGVFEQKLSAWIDVEAFSPAAHDVVVRGVCQDSRLCEAGDAYLALAGATTHGYRFAMAAIEKGATAVLVSPDVAAEFASTTEAIHNLNIPLIELDQLDTTAADLAAKFYGFPSKTLNIIAITGTDGKTTVCQFVKEALTNLGSPCGYIGTLGWGVNDCGGETSLTTPDAIALQRMLATMLQAGAKAVALEASSHGIAEGRLDKIDIDIAVLTNLGRDHLDYHSTEAAYREAKANLFYWPTLKAIVVNADDELGETLATAAYSDKKVQVYAFSRRSRDLAGTVFSSAQISLERSGIQFDLVDEEQHYAIATPLYGRFNIDNLLACHGVLRACGVAANDSAIALQQLERVPGRMEPFAAFAQPTVVVDYAHTPQALSAAIAAVREHVQGELWVVFGCGGDRDAGKRALMAQAAQAADRVVVTDDNPRNEQAAHIRTAIINGFTKASDVLEIGDRERAIQYAIWHAQPDDVVLLAGKGHEDYQIVGNEVRYFSDRDVVSRLLQEAG